MSRLCHGLARKGSSNNNNLNVLLVSTDNGSMNTMRSAVSSPRKLKAQFTSCGGLALEVDDEERFFVECKPQSPLPNSLYSASIFLDKIYAKRFPDEEALFNEICSSALNNDRIINKALLEKVAAEVCFARFHLYSNNEQSSINRKQSSRTRLRLPFAPHIRQQPARFSRAGAKCF